MSRMLGYLQILLAQTAVVAASASIWPSQSYVTETFKAPNISVVQYGPTAPGYLFFTPSGSDTVTTSPLIFTDDNQLVWSGPDEDYVYADLNVQQFQGKPHITYWQGARSATFGHGYGSVHILNSSYQEVFEVCPDGLDIVPPGNQNYPCLLDTHESFITSQDTIVSTAYNVTPFDLTSVGGPKHGWILDSLFYEIDIATNEVLFRWRSSDHMDRIPLTESHDPLGFSGKSNADPWDYFHINSVQKLSDGYLVNSRNLFSTYKVYFNGSIEWHLSGFDGGDFKLGPDVYYSWQHRPRIQPTSDSSILPMVLFNNDNSEVQNGTNSTTGLELAIDVKNRVVTLERKQIVPTELIWTDSQGSSQPLPNNHVLIGYGQIPKIREFDGDDQLVYEATFGFSIGGGTTSSYRDYRYEWQGYPATSPKAVIRGRKLYMSWNGATEISNWGIYTGKSCQSLTLLASTKKTGFETSYSLPNIGQGQVIVEARDASGKGLGNSSCI